MRVPAEVREEIRKILWEEADRLNWSALASTDKSRYYTNWTEAEAIGGRLGRYMDPRKVRVYIKDTLLKSYMREASADPTRIMRVLGIAQDEAIAETYIKPHGCLLSDGRQIAWSKSSEWKATLMAIFERSFEIGKPFAVVLTESAAKFDLASERDVVEIASQRLGIQKIVWLD
ncbi:hypothetical protein [Ruegeria meonggei]|uniref:Uncharacterized protein n=1 Tax=Ruegeria meonggei TaxID=1446476 RepID=A0A1X6YM12_9RHOB|nr:hypothetical protein [Ruegeria meonggei]SLN25149.1 hypothetical protein RUM8411_01010 [Ruegeria meonggei]